MPHFGLTALLIGSVAQADPTYIVSPVPDSLGPLDHRRRHQQRRQPLRINDAGQVIGHAQLVVLTPGDPSPTVEITSAAFFWDIAGGMQNLGDLAVADINNHGAIVGGMTVEAPDGPRPHAFMRSAKGEIADLDALVRTYNCNERTWLRNAPAINDAGEIVVTEQWCPDSVFVTTRAFVLLPRACAADLTGDAGVDVFDLLSLLPEWGACPE